VLLWAQHNFALTGFQLSCPDTFSPGIGVRNEQYVNAIKWNLATGVAKEIADADPVGVDVALGGD